MGAAWPGAGAPPLLGGALPSMPPLLGVEPGAPGSKTHTQS